MKYEIKRFNDTDAVVISNEEPKINDWYNSNLGINKLGSTTRYVEKYREKIIATISPFKIGGLPMLELPNQEEDIKRLALDYAKTPILNHKEQDLNTEIWISGARQQGFIAGYKAAQKQFSEEDMINAIQMARGIREGKETFTAEDISGCTEVCTYDWTYEYEEGEILQSLQKKQFPTSVELTEDLQIIKWYYE